jgi:hypothetical protein
VKYDVKHFKVMARLDERTSKICRAMHGRIIPAEHLDKQTDKMLSSNTIEQKKASSIWPARPIYGKLPSNFGTPPYHFRCRTQIIPVYLQNDIIDGKKVTYADKKAGDIITHIDKTGVQRRVNHKTFNKLQKRHKISKAKLIGSLNSIDTIAPHSDPLKKDQVVTKSSNGVFMTFKGERLITAFSPSRSSKNYFKDNANMQQKQVIKWLKEKLISLLTKNQTTG